MCNGKFCSLTCLLLPATTGVGNAQHAPPLNPFALLLVQDLTSAGIPSLTPEEVSFPAELRDASGAAGLPAELTPVSTCSGGPSCPLDITCMMRRSQSPRRTKQCCLILAMFDERRHLMRWSWGGRCSSMCGRPRTTKRWAAAEDVAAV